MAHHERSRRKEDYTGRIANILVAAGLLVGAFDLVPKQWFEGYPTLSRAPELSRVLLLIGLVIYVHYTYEKLEHIDSMVDRISRADVVAAQGSVAEKIARLLNPQDDEERLAHRTAGARALSHAVQEHIPETVRSLLDFTDRRSAKLEEDSLIARYLVELIRALPPGSIWLGISLLENPEAWDRNSINKVFAEFEEDCRTRIERGDLLYYRLFQFDDSNKSRIMDSEMLRQQREGRLVRYEITKQPDDLSIIFVAKRPLRPAPADSGPIAWSVRELNARPLCALQFDIRHNIDFSKLNIFNNDNEKFHAMERIFDAAWLRAKTPERDVAQQISGTAQSVHLPSPTTHDPE